MHERETHGVTPELPVGENARRIPQGAAVGRMACLGLVAVAAAVAVVGCGDKPEPKTIVVGAVAPAPAAPPAGPADAAAAADPLGPRYAASLAEGINFTRPGYPDFVSAVSGISSYEPQGRWTDANLASTATIRFKQPLPAKLTVELTVNAFGPNLGESIYVRVGEVEKSFVHADPRQLGTYKLVFETSIPADRIEIVPPKPVSPSELNVGADTRRVGVSLVALKIVN